jgi:hypothetical protein
MALTGKLEEVDVPSLIELARQGPTLNRLSILGETASVTLYLVHGELVHASLNGQDSNVDALQTALQISVGTFELEKGAATPPQRTINTPWNTLLIQALQLIDESRQNNPTISHTQETLTMATKEKPEDVIKEMANDMEPGLKGMGVVGTDGLGIVFHKVSGEAADSLGSQMALIMQLSKRSAERVERGEVEDVLVTTDKSYLVGRMLGEGAYFLVVNVERDSVLGNVRLTMRNYADRLLKSIPGAK